MNEKQYRTLTLESVRADAKSQTFEASLSSEEPVERDFGVEVLKHSPDSVDLSRAKDGLPLLFSHDTREPVGIVENVRLAGRKLRGVLRFGNSTRAREVFADVAAGILRNLSIGYQIQKTEEREGVFTATRWLLLEASIVSVPADSKVGIGRAYSDRKTNNNQEARKMPTPEKTEENFNPGNEPGSIKTERERVAKILDYGKRFGADTWAETAVREGTSFNSFREYVLEKRESLKDTDIILPSNTIGLSEREAGRFSIRKLILAAATNDWSDAGLEREALRATGPGAHGGYVLPGEVLFAPMRRDLTTSNSSSLIPTDHLDASFVEYLRSRTVIRNLGATFLPGLHGDVSIPRQSGASTVSWVGEGNDLSESALSTDAITLSPKSVGAFTDFTRRMMLQSSPAIEALIRQDLASSVAVELDRVAFMGSGGTQPYGIIPTVSGSYTVALTSNVLDWPAIVQLEGMVAANNADREFLAYATNSAVRSKLKRTIKDDGDSNNVQQMVWGENRLDERGFDLLNNYPAAVSNVIPSNLNPGANKSAMVFGNFKDLIVGEWSNVEIAVDPYALFTSGGIRVRVFYDVDMAVRHAQSFAVVTDASTA